MTVTSRLTVYFSATLTAALLLASVLVYVWARRHNEHQIDLHLASAMNTLTAAAEVEPSGVEWDREHRQVNLRRLFDQPVVWCVLGSHGEIIDRSGTDTEWLTEKTIPSATSWRVASQRLIAPPVSTVVADGKHFNTIEIRAAIDASSADANLQRLAIALSMVTLAILLSWAFVARWVCRRALRPLTVMAADTRAIAGDDPDARLSVHATTDELSELANAFNDLLQRQQQSRRRLQDFAGHASHQLRNPLAGLMGQIEVALRYPRSADEYRTALETSQRSASQLHAIVNSLLRLTRNDPRERSRTERVEIRHFFDEWQRTHSDHPRVSDLQLAVAQRLCITTDPTLLAQLVDILFDNAAKYSPTGTPIRIHASGVENDVQILVANVGEIIPAPNSEILFEPFYRTPDAIARGIPGTGLGLAIAKTITGVLGGTIAAHSVSNGTVEFTVRLSQDKEE